MAGAAPARRGGSTAIAGGKLLEETSSKKLGPAKQRGRNWIAFPRGGKSQQMAAKSRMH